MTESAVPEHFSREAAGAQLVEVGKGKWWNVLLVPNTGPESQTLAHAHTSTLSPD